MTGSFNDSQKSSGQTPSYACFESTRVLVCGFSEDTVLQQLTKAIEAGGGRVVTRLSQRALPHIIICGNVLDKAYRVRRRRTPRAVRCAPAVVACSAASGSCWHSPWQLTRTLPRLAGALQEARRATQGSVPAVSKDWVDACIRLQKQARRAMRLLASTPAAARRDHAASSAHLGVLLTAAGCATVSRAAPQVDFRPYQLQPLSGLLISATNFVGRVERQHLQDRITAAGAAYSAELRKETCSHLVARSLAGPKCKCVLQGTAAAAAAGDS